MNTWNRERKRTRDRLLDYDVTIMPPRPHSGGIPIIYPWETIITPTFISEQLYYIATQAGFTGSKHDFLKKFGNNDGLVIKGTLSTFPVIGNKNNLYLDEDSGIVYYFKQTTKEVIIAEAARIGAAIIETSLVEKDNKKTIINNLYIPISALMIENELFN